MWICGGWIWVMGVMRYAAAALLEMMCVRGSTSYAGMHWEFEGKGVRV